MGKKQDQGIDISRRTGWIEFKKESADAADGGGKETTGMKVMGETGAVRNNGREQLKRLEIRLFLYSATSSGGNLFILYRLRIHNICMHNANGEY